MYSVKNEVYLEIMYKALFTLGYYGMMRVGELTFSQHVVKAHDIHIAHNKDKIMIVLYSSKTHSQANRPQKIKITSNRLERTGSYVARSFCPFELVLDYYQLRGGFQSETEPFFIFTDRRPVQPDHARRVLNKAITSIGLDPTCYRMHSLCIGRTSDLIRFHYSLDKVRHMGQWRMKVVFKYIRQ